MEDLTNEGYFTFQEYSFIKVVNGGANPDKGIGWLRRTGNLSIPAMSICGSTENQLAPAVINAEVVDFFYADSNWPDDVI